MGDPRDGGTWRGAIGATAAYGLAQGARAFHGRDAGEFRRRVETVFQTLKAARPTAIDPENAMTQVRQAMAVGETVAEQQALGLAAAEEFANEDVRHCAALGQQGAKLIRDGMNVLTHCNAGWLAFVDVGSADRARSTPPRRGGSSFTSIAMKPGRVPRVLLSPHGSWRSKASRIRLSPTTPPGT